MAVNDYVSNTFKFKYQSLDDAKKLVNPNCYMAKVSIYLYDTKLPFGSKEAPGIFHRHSQAVRRMMVRRGFTIVAYLDDFFICEDSKSKCAEALATLLHLLQKLGFYINWKKVEDPTQQIVF